MPQCWGQWHTQILSPRVWALRWKVRKENTTGTGPKILNSNPLRSQSTVVHLFPDLPKNQLISGLTIYLIYTRTPFFSLSTFYLVWQDLILLVSKERHLSDTALCWAMLLFKDCSTSTDTGETGIFIAPHPTKSYRKYHQHSRISVKGAPLAQMTTPEEGCGSSQAPAPRMLPVSP